MRGGELGRFRSRLRIDQSEQGSRLGNHLSQLHQGNAFYHLVKQLALAAGQFDLGEESRVGELALFTRRLARRFAHDDPDGQRQIAFEGLIA